MNCIELQCILECYTLTTTIISYYTLVRSLSNLGLCTSTYSHLLDFLNYSMVCITNSKSSTLTLMDSALALQHTAHWLMTDQTWAIMICLSIGLSYNSLFASCPINRLSQSLKVCLTLHTAKMGEMGLLPFALLPLNKHECMTVHTFVAKRCT